MVVVHPFSEYVEAVYPVLAVDLGKVGIISESPVVWSFDRLGRVFSDFADIFAADGNDANVRNGFPGGVDLFRWRTTVDAVGGRSIK